MNFLAQYGKTYSSKSHLHTRYQTFASNYKQMKTHNAKSDKGYEMGLNQFSDLSLEEFTDQYHKDGLAIPTEETKVVHKPHLGATLVIESETPDNVDWRAAGKVTIPQDQSSCGSCWAFTTASTLEARMAIANNTSPVKFSVQYLIDCDDTNFGCGGGWMLDAYLFTKEKGIVKEDDYPYKYQISQKKCQQL